MIMPLPRREPTSEENVLPLINIVFLLLIFFMITGALSATAPFPVDPPEARSAEATEAPQQGVAIAADGRLAFGDEEVGLDELTEHAAEWRDAAEAGEVLSVRADTDAATRRLVEVMEALRAAEVETIRLLGVGREEEG